MPIAADSPNVGCLLVLAVVEFFVVGVVTAFLWYVTYWFWLVPTYVPAQDDGLRPALLVVLSAAVVPWLLLSLCARRGTLVLVGLAATSPAWLTLLSTRG